MVNPAVSDARESALLDFVDQFCGDAERGEVPSLAHYLARFPEFEQDVAREYLRLVDRREGGPSDSVEDDASRASEPAASDSALDASSEGQVARLRLRRPSAPRYAVQGRIGRGGMGAVFRVRDEDLSRELAMKVMLAGGTRRLRRFLEEAQIAGSLDHPGVVPVHELGLDAKGRVYFTMRLVQGRDLKEIIDFVHSGDPEWTLQRALDVIVKVCDTMAYAHSKDVIHRDLKPSNVMVGNFGEVYVVDWGLARALAREDIHDLRLRDEAAAAPESATESDADPLLLTMDGDIVGTPCYMPPEQARGETAAVGPQSDVYSVGAMLYHLLTGTAPFVSAGERLPARRMLECVLAGPPASVHALRRGVPAELEAICEKAMARDPAARYADMRAMAHDMRAYLELRVVSAYGTGALAELKKWVARNRGLTWSLAGGALIAAAAAVTALNLRETRHNLELLADQRGPALLRASFDDLWPAVPEHAEDMRHWLAQAESLVANRERYRAALVALRTRALPQDPDAPEERRARERRESKLADVDEAIARHENALADVERTGKRTLENESREDLVGRVAAFKARREQLLATPVERLSWRFEDPQDQLQHDALAQLCPELDALAGTPDSPGLIWRVRSGIAFADLVERDSLEIARAEWDAALASIRDPAQCPAYAGLALEPQIGLVPIGRDPDSGLWEFAHLQSGEPAVRGPDGRLRIDEGTGLVLVLVPGGALAFGGQSANPFEPNFDPLAEPNESPVQHLMIKPFFLSKYEMTQAQWKRATGSDPSGFQSDDRPELIRSGLHPVARVDWNAAMSVARQLGLSLPAEAQWEYAARGGTHTPWFTGDEPAALPSYANLADAAAVQASLLRATDAEEAKSLDDGFAAHAPAGSLHPNPFGLHDVLGNVSEWCRDQGRKKLGLAIHLGTGEQEIEPDGSRVSRGGGFRDLPKRARSSSRSFSGAGLVDDGVGLRPSREIDP